MIRLRLPSPCRCPSNEPLSFSLSLSLLLKQAKPKVGLHATTRLGVTTWPQSIAYHVCIIQFSRRRCKIHWRLMVGLDRSPAVWLSHQLSDTKSLERRKTSHRSAHDVHVGIKGRVRPYPNSRGRGRRALRPARSRGRHHHSRNPRENHPIRLWPHRKKVACEH